VTVAVWKAFAVAYRSQAEFLKVFEAPSVLPSVLLSSVIPLVDCKSLDFLTMMHISLPMEPLDVSFYLELSSLRNLRTQLIDADSDACPLPRRVFQAWGTHATEADAFPELQALILRSRSSLWLTDPDLVHLSKLPKLRIIYVICPTVASRQECISTWKCIVRYVFELIIFVLLKLLQAPQTNHPSV
jgi:hypothetical protein